MLLLVPSPAIYWRFIDPPITSRMLEHYGASVSEVADNTEARSQ